MASDTRSPGSPGWIYILTNKSYTNNMLKIGRTQNDPDARASTLSSPTGVPTPFTVAYSEMVPDCVEAESMIHERLRTYRVNNNREFFRVDLQEALRVARETCEQVRQNSEYCRACVVRQNASKWKEKVEQLQNVVDEKVVVAERFRKRNHSLVKRMRIWRCLTLCLALWIRRLVITAQRNLEKAFPERIERSIVAGLLILLGMTCWGVLLAFAPLIAGGVVLTLLLVSALVVLGNAGRPNDGR
jgi:predicted RecB family endonuclease